MRWTGRCRALNEEGDAVSAEAPIRLWGNLPKPFWTHMLGNKTPRQDLLDMLTMLHETE